MAKPRKTAQTRMSARRQRLRERSVVFAAGWSALTIFLVGLAIFVILATLPGMAVHNFWRLLTVNGQVSPSSDLYRSLLAQIERQEALFVSPACLLAGGLVLGRLMPKRITRPRLLRTAGLVSVGAVLVCVLLRWGLIFYGQHGHLRAGELDAQVERSQLICSLAWIMAYLVGAWIGGVWRDAGSGAEGIPCEPSDLSLSPE